MNEERASLADDSQGRAREALRQRALLALLWREPGAGDPGLSGSSPEQARGLAAYRANAAALAARALAAAFPTLQQLLGETSFAALAHAHWHRHPPQQGDLARWGALLPQAVQRDPQLAHEPYLADVARLDWAVHEAALAADDVEAVRGLDLLAHCDPDRLGLRLRMGSAVVSSPFPIFDIWQAHQGLPTADTPMQDMPGDRDERRFETARQALREGRAQAVWISRGGQAAVQVLALAHGGDVFVQAILDGNALASALRRAGDGFDFTAWLIQALSHNAVAEVTWLDGATAATPGQTGAAV